MYQRRARFPLNAGSMAAAAVAFLTFAGPVPAAEPAPRVEITNSVVRPGESLHVWVACAKGTGEGDVRTAISPYTVLDPQAGGGAWYAKPAISAKARAGVYTLHARCTHGPGSPYVETTALFRVSTKPQHWAAMSTTAQSITGNVRVTSSWLTFAADQRLQIRYLRDVSGDVSIFGSSQSRSHGQMYRVLSPSDLRLRSGNMFCGKRPTYLTMLRMASGLDADIVLTVYSATAEPTAGSSDAICASYTYFPDTQ